MNAPPQTAALIDTLRDSLRATFRGFWPQELSLAELTVQALTHLVVASTLITAFVIVYVLLRKLLQMVMKRASLQEEAFRPLLLGLRYVLFLLAVLAIMAQLGVEQALLVSVGRAAMIALLFYVAWAFVTRVLITLLVRYQLDPSIEQLLRNVVAVLIVAFGVITVLAQFGFDVLSMIAGVGIVGIAVGFAAQSTLSNFIAGITILIERPFRIGDWVKVNDQEGKVMKITLRTTWLRTRDNIFTMIPNDSVASSDIVNYSAEGALRVRIPLGIAYKESIAAARAVILPILEAHEHVLKSEDMMPAVSTGALADSSIELRALYWISPDKIDIQPRISAQLLERIKEGLDAAGIEIPFPHLQLFIDDAKGLKPVLEPLYAIEGGKSQQRLGSNDNDTAR